MELNRRLFLGRAGLGFGSLALSSMHKGDRKPWALAWLCLPRTRAIGCHGRWRGFGETTVIDLGSTQLERDTVFQYTHVFENERGMKAMAAEVWEDLQIGLFSSVWDVVSGREEILECTADSDYCRNLFVVGHRRQVYCDPLCRKSEGMRKLRNKNKLREAEEAENAIRV